MIIVTQVVLLFGTVVLLSPSVLSARREKTPNCSPFPHAYLEHGRITVSGVQKYTFHCNHGYFLSSPKQVRCWKGKWSSTREPKCSRAEGFCEELPPIPGGEILGKERHVGSVVQYMCNPGYVLLGEGKRSCLRSGHWNGITPACMDESEPVQKVAERLKNKFVTEIGSYSSDSVVPEGRLLDRDSIKHGLELVILIDRSSSVDPRDFKVGVGFIKFLFHQFGVKNGNNTSGTRAAVMTFGTKVDILFNLDNDTISGPSAASRALDTLEAGGGGTAMEEALISVFTRLPPTRENAKKAIFMLTDGEPNIGTVEDTLFFARQLREEQSFEIFTVGIGRGINRQLLSKLASEPAINHVFVLDKYSDLKNVIQTIRDKSPGGPRISASRCGHIRYEGHYLKRWPWLSAIYVGLPDKTNSSKLGFCAGTLICSQWIITAASCFYELHKTNISEIEFQVLTREVFIVLGEKDLINEDRNQMNFYAEDVIIHPHFSPLEDLQNNLALVKLNTPAPMGRFRPACLPPTDRPVLLHLDLNTNASIAGWGLPQSMDDDREITGSKVEFHSSNITVVLEEEGECERVSGSAARENIFCAGGHGIHTCIGDLGSPIIAVDPSTNLHHLIGVLSKRANCQQGINQYSELTKYIGWINDSTNRCQFQHYMV